MIRIFVLLICFAQMNCVKQDVKYQNKIDTLSSIVNKTEPQIKISDAEITTNDFLVTEIKYLESALDFYKNNNFNILPIKLINGYAEKYHDEIKTRLEQEKIAIVQDKSKHTLLLSDSIKLYQFYNNLKVTGEINQQTIDSLNHHNKHILIQQNLEHLKEIKKQIKSNDYIIVNLPEYILHFVSQGKEVANMEVQVGSKKQPTPSMVNKLYKISFNPDWVVPYSVFSEVILPQLQKNPKMLVKDGFSLKRYKNRKWLDYSILSVDWRNVYSKDYWKYKLTMNPGVKNPMGKAKFYLTNDQYIMIHGSNDKENFFDEENAQSAGCIRVYDSLALVKVVFKHYLKYDNQKIEDIIKQHLMSKSDFNIQKPVITALTYQTVKIDDNGYLKFFNDVYNKYSS